jgi:S-DNA-T family DNA segregation ATPase FtsK/SpoIIIE
VFVALSPLIAVGTWIDRRYTSGKEAKTQAARFTGETGKLSTRLGESLDEEQRARRGEVPSLDALLTAAFSRSPDLWHRRPENDDFMTVNLGYGRTASRHRLLLPERGDATDESWQVLTELKHQCGEVNDVPIVAGLRQSGNLGLAGPRSWLDPVAGNMVAQIACLHSPAEVTVAGLASAESAGRWDWLMWLPHVGSAYSPIPGVAHLASRPGGVSSLVSSLEELVAARTASRQADRGPVGPAVVVVVEDDTPVERGRLAGLAEQGPAVGVHQLWLAEHQQRLPAACHAYLVPDPGGQTATAGFVKDHRVDTVTRLESLNPVQADLLGRRLSPVVDAGAPVIDQSDIPRAVSYLALAGPGLADDPGATVERWQEDGSLRPHPAMSGKSAATLRGLIGQGSHGAVRRRNRLADAETDGRAVPGGRADDFGASAEHLLERRTAGGSNYPGFPDSSTRGLASGIAHGVALQP